MLRGERGAGECRLLSGPPSHQWQAEQVVGFLLVLIAGRDNSDRSAIASRSAKVTHMRHFSFFFVEFLEPSMANRGLVVPESPGFFAPR